MGRFLTAAGELPTLAMTSPAVRAKRTLELAMAAGGWTCPAVVSSGLYGEAEEILTAIRSAPWGARRLLIVGHEPALSAAAEVLTAGTAVRLPTAAMLALDLSADEWHAVADGTAQISWLVTPRLLKLSHR